MPYSRFLVLLLLLLLPWMNSAVYTRKGGENNKSVDGVGKAGEREKKQAKRSGYNDAFFRQLQT